MKVGQKIKNLLLNKNVVTILAVFAGIIVLWFIYNTTLSRAISPVKIPVAARDLLEGTKITMEDITYVEVNSAFVKRSKIITSPGAITQKYVTNGTSIPKGGMFYQDLLVDKEKLVERELQIIGKDETLYNLKVNNNSTCANSIYPGDRIDLWIKASGSKTNNQIAYEPFITSIEVLSVKDSSRKYNVFDGSNKRTPGFLVFAVDKEMNKILMSVEKLPGMELFPVPKNKEYTDLQAETAFANEAIKYYVTSQIQ